MYNLKSSMQKRDTNLSLTKLSEAGSTNPTQQLDS